MKPYRIEKVSSTLRALVSEAICKLQDPRITPLISVTRVKVSRDLEWAKVYVSVFGGAPSENKTMAALKHASGHIQSTVARKLTIRQCPHLSFHLDASLKKGNEILRLIDASMQEFKQTRSGEDDS